MANDDELFITSPVGRLVQGDVYTPRTKDMHGNPLVVKTGPNVGQPRVDYFISIAVPKKPGETHWNQTDWGAKIYQAAVAAWPQGQYQRSDFAWKIDDGDSTIPNKKGRVNANTDGFPGCWIISISSGFAPQIVNKDGSQKIIEEGAVKRGYYVQVYFGVRSNQNAQNPGMYLNHRLVALNAYGEEIKGAEVDATTVGFGQAPTPAGALTTPAAGLGTVAAPTPAGYVPPPAPPAAAPVVAPPPAPEVLQPPAPARQLTAKANGASYEQLVAAGWTDDLLRQHGLMV